MLLTNGDYFMEWVKRKIDEDKENIYKNQPQVVAYYEYLRDNFFDIYQLSHTSQKVYDALINLPYKEWGATIPELAELLELNNEQVKLAFRQLYKNKLIDIIYDGRPHKVYRARTKDILCKDVFPYNRLTRNERYIIRFLALTEEGEADIDEIITNTKRSQFEIKEAIETLADKEILEKEILEGYPTQYHLIHAEYY